MAAKVPKSYRLPEPLVRRLAEVAAERRVDQTALVEEALTRALEGAPGTERRRAVVEVPTASTVGAPPTRDTRPVPSSLPVGAQAPGGEARVDLAQLASDLTGLPLAVCRAKIHGRALTVDGSVWVDPLIRVAKLDAATVVFDGVVLVPAGAATE